MSRAMTQASFWSIIEKRHHVCDIYRLKQETMRDFHPRKNVGDVMERDVSGYKIMSSRTSFSLYPNSCKKRDFMSAVCRHALLADPSFPLALFRQNWFTSISFFHIIKLFPLWGRFCRHASRLRFNQRHCDYKKMRLSSQIIHLQTKFASQMTLLDSLTESP